MMKKFSLPLLAAMAAILFFCILNFAKGILPQQEPTSSAAVSRRINASADTEWNLILVNRENPIPEDWQSNLIELKSGESVDERIYPYLQKMFDDARADGVYPYVVSGYRTKEIQQRLLDEKIKEYELEGYSKSRARDLALSWVALPDTSEHQLGIAVDINAEPPHRTSEPVYEWLDENAHKYGFIKRYPADKTEITGIIYEPWHYRYVGIEAATEIHSLGICLEEYIQLINED